MATHSSILAWRIPWPENSGGLQSIGLQRIRHDSQSEGALCWLGWEGDNEEGQISMYNK